jgi:hypothetical protein
MLPRSENPGVSRDNPARLVGKHRVRPAPLLHARRKLRDLSLGMGPGIFRIRDQPVDRPALDLIRRPCALARARVARRRLSSYPSRRMGRKQRGPVKRVVLNWAAHALDGLLCAVAGLGLQVLVDVPHRGLLMIAGPLARRALAHRVPARLVLAVIMAAADRKVVFRPDDLRSSIKSRSAVPSRQAIVCHASCGRPRASVLTEIGW